jgi:adenylate kinase
MQKTYFLFFGPPGSGKGTQSDMLGKEINFPVISPGEILRHEEEAESELGKKVRPLIDAGELVPDEIVEEMIASRLEKPDAECGAIFDGFPRTEKQLSDLDMRFEAERALTAAILIDVGDEEVLKRLSGRRVCDCGAAYHLTFNPPKIEGICDLCGKELEIRPDDKPEIMRKRLADYHAESAPLIDFWERQGKLCRIDGSLSVDEVHQLIYEYAKSVIQS